MEKTANVFLKLAQSIDPEIKLQLGNVMQQVTDVENQEALSVLDIAVAMMLYGQSVMGMAIETGLQQEYPDEQERAKILQVIKQGMLQYCGYDNSVATTEAILAEMESVLTTLNEYVDDSTADLETCQAFRAEIIDLSQRIKLAREKFIDKNTLN